MLSDLVDRGIIRILDLVFVRRDSDGSTTVLTIADVGGDGSCDLAIFDGASSGMLRDDDIEEVATAVRAGSSAAILIYENRCTAQCTGPHMIHKVRSPALRQ